MSAPRPLMLSVQGAEAAVVAFGAEEVAVSDCFVLAVAPEVCEVAAIEPG